MTNDDETSLLTFPCRFTIKAIGKASNDFEVAVLSIVHSHFSEIGEAAIATRESSKGKYLSLSITVTAISQDQLDKVYQELSAHELIDMVL